jgi:hypothetical protein
LVLKVVGNEKRDGIMSNDRNWSRTVVIDVLLSFSLAAILYKILFLFLLIPAEGIVSGLMNKGSAANCLPHHILFLFEAS